MRPGGETGLGRRTLTRDNGWTGGQYSLFRCLFGLYLAVHFAHLLPWGAELFSERGMIAEASASPLAYLFPNLLTLFDSPGLVVALLAAGVLLALAFGAGYRDRWAALALWYLWACLHARNPLIGNPALPYVGWMLLAHAALPRGPWGSLQARAEAACGSRPRWRFPSEIFGVAWVLMVAGYTYSGLTKLGSPSWRDGSALLHVLENPLARVLPVRELLLSLPHEWLQLATWSTLAIEIAAAPLALSRRLRPVVWSALLGLHLALLLLIDFADLSLGMILLHLFTFDPAWIPHPRGRQIEHLILDPDWAFYRAACRFVRSEDRLGSFCIVLPSSTLARSLLREAGEGRRVSPLAVLDEAGVLHSGWPAAVHVLNRLGGLWSLLARGWARACVSTTPPAASPPLTSRRAASLRRYSPAAR